MRICVRVCIVLAINKRSNSEKAYIGKCVFFFLYIRFSLSRFFFILMSPQFNYDRILSLFYIERRRTRAYCEHRQIVH